MENNKKRVWSVKRLGAMTLAGTMALSLAPQTALVSQAAGATALNADNVLVEASKTYDGSAFAPKLYYDVNGNGEIDEGDAEITYVTADGAATDEVIASLTAVDGGTGNAGITDAGNYTLTISTIEEDSDYAFDTDVTKIEKSFSIEQYDISAAGAVVGWNIDPQTYNNGKSVTIDESDITAKDTAGNNITKSIKSYTNNKVVGTATVKIEGTGNYTGTYTGEFEIVGIDISGATVTLASDLSYTGEEVEPAVSSVVLNEKTLTEGTDYTVEYTTAATDADAIGEITITGIGNYSGTATKNFTVVAKAIGESDVVITSDTVYFDNAEVTDLSEFNVKVTLNGKELVAGTDYDLAKKTADQEIKAAGGYVLTITPKGNYSGAAIETTVTVAKLDLSKMTVTASDFTYDGTEQTPDISDFTFKDGDTDVTTLVSSLVEISAADAEAGTTTAATDAGDYKLEIVALANGNADGSILVDWSIDKLDLSTATVTDIADQTFTGEAVTPATEVKVSLNGVETVLTADEDYTVSYENNVNASSEAKAVITAKDGKNYTGSCEKTFTIAAMDISAVADITLEKDSVTYNGSAQVPVVSSVKVGDTTLVADEDYEVTLSVPEDKFVAADDYTVTITGKGNYSGTKDATYTIEAIDLDAAKTAGKLEVTIPQQPVGASEIVGAVEVKVGDIVLPYSDYTFSNITTTVVGETGTAKLQAGSTNVTTAGVDVEFEVGKDIDATTVKYLVNGEEADALPDQVYTGSEIKPEVVVYDSDVKLTKGTDYEVKYYENIAVGTNSAVIVISGIGDYAGYKELNFTIVANASGFTEDDITVGALSYTGEVLEPVVTVGELTVDDDYTVAYYSNEECNSVATVQSAGKYYAKVTGANGYAGTTAVKEFTVDTLSLEGATITIAGEDAEGNCVVAYTGSEVKPNVTVKDALGNDVATDQYDVTYANNTNLGTATVTVTAKEDCNYTKDSKVEKTFTIARSLDSTATVIDESSVVDSVYGITPSLDDFTLLWMGDELEEGVDYTVEISGVTSDAIPAVGQYDIVVTGLGKYTGTKTFTGAYGVHALDLDQVDSSMTITLYDENDNVIDRLVATGEELEPTISYFTISVDDITLKISGDDFTPSYNNNVDVGVATVTLSGKGVNVTNETETTFNIISEDVAEVEALIEALPATVTTSDEAQITAARAAYEALSDADKADVTNLDVLEAAEAALAQAKAEAAKQNEETPAAEEQQTPADTTNNGNTSGDTTNNTNTTTTTSTAPAVGTEVTVGNVEVEVTGTNTVAYEGTAKSTKTVSIPSTVTINGSTYTVTEIAANALKNDKKVTKVVIPASVTKIGKNAFKGCSKLKTIKVYGNNLKTVSKNAFKGIKKNAKITVLAKNKSTYNKIVKKLKKAGAKNATFKFKKSKKK